MNNKRHKNHTIRTQAAFNAALGSKNVAPMLLQRLDNFNQHWEAHAESNSTPGCLDLARSLVAEIHVKLGRIREAKRVRRVSTWQCFVPRGMDTRARNILKKPSVLPVCHSLLLIDDTRNNSGQHRVNSLIRFDTLDASQILQVLSSHNMTTPVLNGSKKERENKNAMK